MGCNQTKVDPAQRQKNSEIEKQLEQSKRDQQNHVKLLLLGAGESGKSTIAKQMKIIHLDGFSKDELLNIRSIIFSNIVGSVRVLVENAYKLNNEISPENQGYARKVLDDNYFTGELTPAMAKDIKTLWNDQGIKATFNRSAEFQLNDSAEYYFTEIDRIAQEEYMPTHQDVLRSRIKTTGIIETHFSVGNTHFTLVDVGGQRSERRKWIHCFQDVTAVIFVVALSEYDQKLYEDETTNRMHEALKLFKDICHTKWFSETAIILFLNKKDIFEKKIQKVPLSICFKDYDGPNTYEAASQYIEDQFLAQNEISKKLIYVKHTCATDTENITVVFRAVQDIVVNKILEKIGI